MNLGSIIHISVTLQLDLSRGDSNLVSSEDSCNHPLAGVADKICWLMQCQAKASSVQDVLQLLVGNSSSTSTGSVEVESSAATAALRSCLSSAMALVKALESQKKDMFQMWQVWSYLINCSCCLAPVCTVHAVLCVCPLCSALRDPQGEHALLAAFFFFFLFDSNV